VGPPGCSRTRACASGAQSSNGPDKPVSFRQVCVGRFHRSTARVAVSQCRYRFGFPRNTQYVPRKSRKRRQANHRSDAQRQSLVTLHSHRRRACRSTYARHISIGSIPSTRCPAWQESSSRGRLALAVDHHPSLAQLPSPYRDLGATYFDERERGAVRRRLVNRLQRLG
jgi:hypothetical protein